MINRLLMSRPKKAMYSSILNIRRQTIILSLPTSKWTDAFVMFIEVLSESKNEFKVSANLLAYQSKHAFSISKFFPETEQISGIHKTQAPRIEAPGHIIHKSPFYTSIQTSS